MGAPVGLPTTLVYLQNSLRLPGIFLDVRHVLCGEMAFGSFIGAAQCQRLASFPAHHAYQ